MELRGFDSATTIYYLAFNSTMLAILPSILFIIHFYDNDIQKEQNFSWEMLSVEV